MDGAGADGAAGVAGAVFRDTGTCVRLSPSVRLTVTSGLRLGIGSWVGLGLGIGLRIGLGLGFRNRDRRSEAINFGANSDRRSEPNTVHGQNGRAQCMRRANRMLVVISAADSATSAFCSMTKIIQEIY